MELGSAYDNGGSPEVGKQWLPPGFRFHPTDEELVVHYLEKKIADWRFTVRAISEADLNKSEPWELPEKAKMGEKEWYFFSLKDRKYPTGMRTNRATESGYWKATGKDREVWSSKSESHKSKMVLIGMKKTLVFYSGRAPKGVKTNWVMHEYRAESSLTRARLRDEWVLCRVFHKTAGGKKLSMAEIKAAGAGPSLSVATCSSTCLPPESRKSSVPVCPSLFSLPAILDSPTDDASAHLNSFLQWYLELDIKPHELHQNFMQQQGPRNPCFQVPAPPLVDSASHRCTSFSCMVTQHNETDTGYHMALLGGCTDVCTQDLPPFAAGGPAALPPQSSPRRQQENLARQQMTTATDGGPRQVGTAIEEFAGLGHLPRFLSDLENVQWI